MRTKMSGRLGNLKRRRRDKCGADKASAKRRTTDVKRPKPAPCTAASPQHGPIMESLISCECHLSLLDTRRRCAASPQPGEHEGKENDLRRARGTAEKRQAEPMDDCDLPEKITYPDDDSNQILPVEQFFGNLDVVQEYLQRPAATSMRSRREHRRRHFYAPEDSDEDVCYSDMQCEHRGGTSPTF